VAGPAGRSRYVRRDGLRIAYGIRRPRWRRLPWLVLVQGLGFDRSGWAPVIDGLAERFALLLVDNRGSGASDAPVGRLAVADMAGDVLAVLDDASIAQAHLAGISLGGMIAQEVAIEHGDRVLSLVLAGTTPGWPIAYPMPASTVALMSGRITLRRQIENALGPETVRDRPDVVDALLAAHSSGNPAGFAAQLRAGARFGSLKQSVITAPTLVLHGGADRVVDPRNARLLADRIPGARLAVLPGLGHLFPWEAPAEFVELVTGFALSPAAAGKDLP
jgi:pimeloyl-ACP methyl ester carboxylesterase